MVTVGGVGGCPATVGGVGGCPATVAGCWETAVTGPGAWVTYRLLQMDRYVVPATNTSEIQVFMLS